MRLCAKYASVGLTRHCRRSCPRKRHMPTCFGHCGLDSPSDRLKQLVGMVHPLDILLFDALPAFFAEVAAAEEL